MIRFAKENDRAVVFDLYCRATGSSNPAIAQGLFDNTYESSNCLVNEINGHIVAAVQLRYIPVMLHNKKVMSCFVIWQLRDGSKNSKYLTELFQKAIEYQQYKAMLTYIRETSANQYQKYGFESLYPQRLYTIARSNVEGNSFAGVSRDFDVATIRELYRQFTESFNGYQFRSTEYYQHLIPLLQNRKLSLAVYYNEDNQAQGYMIYAVEYNRIVVWELVYLNALALNRLICYGLRNRSEIEVYTSQYENLLKIYPTVHYKEVSGIAVKINDYDLFNKLYSSEVSACRDGFYLEDRPLYLNELSI